MGTDGEARAVLEDARRRGAPFPPLGLLGGDLCRTLGGTGDTVRLRSDDAVTLTVDLGEVLLDGRLHLFVAHLVARTPLWASAFAAMNAQWLGSWQVAPRAHPNDGLLDVYEAALSLPDRWRARTRLPRGAHLPHPRVKERRVPAVQVSFPGLREVRVDGEPLGRFRALSVRLEPDAVTVVV